MGLSRFSSRHPRLFKSSPYTMTTTMTVMLLRFILHKLLRIQTMIRAHDQPPAWALVKILPKALHIGTQNMITRTTEAGRIQGANQGGRGVQAGVVTDTDIDNDGGGRTHTVLGGVGHNPGHDHGHDHGRGQGTLRGPDMIIVAMTIRARGQVTRRAADLQTFSRRLENHIRRLHNLTRDQWLQVWVDLVMDTNETTMAAVFGSRAWWRLPVYLIHRPRSRIRFLTTLLWHIYRRKVPHFCSLSSRCRDLWGAQTAMEAQGREEDSEVVKR